jgi:hypothetical protein
MSDTHVQHPAAAAGLPQTSSRLLGGPEWRMDFTTMDNTADSTAAAALHE